MGALLCVSSGEFSYACLVSLFSFSLSSTLRFLSIRLGSVSLLNTLIQLFSFLSPPAPPWLASAARMPHALPLPSHAASHGGFGVNQAAADQPVARDPPVARVHL